MRRSECPISNALDHLGDKWSLLLIRDLAFTDKRSYNALLKASEGIATNVLSNRLSSLEASGIVSRSRDPNDGRKHIYCLTEAGIDLIPLLIDMMLWSEKHDPEGLDIPGEFLDKIRQNRQGVIEQIQQNLRAKQECGPKVTLQTN